MFFTGGDQLRPTSQLGDTPVFQAVHKLYHDGGVVAGTSAGGSVLSDTMLVSGGSESSPKAGDAPGVVAPAGGGEGPHVARPTVMLFDVNEVPLGLRPMREGTVTMLMKQLARPCD